MTIKRIMATWSVSRATAYRAREQGYILTDDEDSTRGRKQGRPSDNKPPKGFGLPEPLCKRIAKLSSDYVTGRQRIWTGKTWMRDTDLAQEAYQAALIALWRSGASSEALAFDVGRKAALGALRVWRDKRASPLDRWLETYEADGAGGLSMGNTED